MDQNQQGTTQTQSASPASDLPNQTGSTMPSTPSTTEPTMPQPAMGVDQPATTEPTMPATDMPEKPADVKTETVTAPLGGTPASSTPQMGGGDTGSGQPNQ